MLRQKILLGKNLVISKLNYNIANLSELGNLNFIGNDSPPKLERGILAVDVMKGINTK